MFWSKRDADPGDLAKLEKQRDELKEQVEDLTLQVTTLKHEHKLADEDVKHMVRIREEQLDVEYDKKVVELERKTQEEIAKVKDEYRDKLEKRLQAEVDNIKEMYAQILERLPNVTAKLRGEV